ncbi:NUDIX hydrolase [Sulfobacillus harzensis]|uniref:NUDIX domain-containing protein n=1 Tax=Sulfobacillus harzensis TaxID=2729629 RepID=A0A7Y0L3M9_9FIRM|nr:NUDIX domain-containing protein [Sulfobacillus harzensis]NMP21810.1 NUDIX domain-containing protein [Sulfobacillus harzensis]
MAKNPKIGVAGIIVNDRRVVLGRRGHDPGYGLWAFPGGHVEFGERLEDALCREVQEETDLLIIPSRPIYIAQLLGSDYHFVLIDFLVTDFSGVLRAGSDLDEVRWVEEKEAAALPLADGMAACLADRGVREILGWM